MNINNIYRRLCQGLILFGLVFFCLLPSATAETFLLTPIREGIPITPPPPHPLKDPALNIFLIECRKIAKEKNLDQLTMELDKTNKQKRQRDLCIHKFFDHLDTEFNFDFLVSIQKDATYQKLQTLYETYYEFLIPELIFDQFPPIVDRSLMPSKYFKEYADGIGLTTFIEESLKKLGKTTLTRRDFYKIEEQYFGGGLIGQRNKLRTVRGFLESKSYALKEDTNILMLNHKKQAMMLDTIRREIFLEPLINQCITLIEKNQKQPIALPVADSKRILEQYGDFYFNATRCIDEFDRSQFPITSPIANEIMQKQEYIYINYAYWAKKNKFPSIIRQERMAHFPIPDHLTKQFLEASGFNNYIKQKCANETEQKINCEQDYKTKESFFGSSQRYDELFNDFLGNNFSNLILEK